MSEVFGIRSLIYWWGFFTATVFLQEWLTRASEFFKTTDMFSEKNVPFSIKPGLNGAIDGASEYIRSKIQFNPALPIVSIGSFSVPGWALAIIFGLILLAIAISLYIRALNTDIWFDDMIALFVIYVVFRVEGHIVAVADLPISASVRGFVNNPTTAFLLLAVLLLFLVFFGEGFHSQRAFWRALGELTFIALFMFPQETAQLIGYFIGGLFAFGSGLQKNTAFAAIWGLIGLFLALQRLMGLPLPGGGPKPAGR